jgi:dTDP-4-dehydrorhamnose 3,5-epimerase
MGDWTVTGRKDSRLVTPDWDPATPIAIDGVKVKTIANVLGDDGRLTEIWRRDWMLDDLPVDQVFQKLMQPGAVSAWHAHAVTTDRLFCALGRVKLVMFDGRRDSPSLGRVAEFRLGEERPALVLIPPGVWHGVRCTSTGPALIINAVDRAYSYGDPDHWRLPADTSDIPYRIV